MAGRTILASLVFAVTLLAATSLTTSESQAAGRGQPSDWQRFYYYPYIYYPHNFQRTPQSFDSLYHRYPQSRQIPVYNKGWYNFYPTAKPYYKGHHFILDVF